MEDCIRSMAAPLICRWPQSRAPRSTGCIKERRGRKYIPEQGSVSTQNAGEGDTEVRSSVLHITSPEGPWEGSHKLSESKGHCSGQTNVISQFFKFELILNTSWNHRQAFLITLRQSSDVVYLHIILLKDLQPQHSRNNPLYFHSCILMNNPYNLLLFSYPTCLHLFCYTKIRSFFIQNALKYDTKRIDNNKWVDLMLYSQRHLVCFCLRGLFDSRDLDIDYPLILRLSYYRRGQSLLATTLVLLVTVSRLCQRTQYLKSNELEECIVSLTHFHPKHRKFDRNWKKMSKTWEKYEELKRSFHRLINFFFIIDIYRKSNCRCFFVDFLR